MRRLTYTVLALSVFAGAASADPAADRQQRLDAARRKAIQAAEKQPTIKAKAFAKTWEREFAKFATDLCACSFGDLECAYALYDAFDVKLTGLAWRIEEREALFNTLAEQAMLSGRDPGEAGAAAGEQLVTTVLEKFVPAARMKKLEARAERCVLHASGQQASD